MQSQQSEDQRQPSFQTFVRQQSIKRLTQQTLPTLKMSKSSKTLSSITSHQATSHDANPQQIELNLQLGKSRYFTSSRGSFQEEHNLGLRFKTLGQQEGIQQAKKIKSHFKLSRRKEPRSPGRTPAKAPGQSPSKGIIRNHELFIEVIRNCQRQKQHTKQPSPVRNTQEIIANYLDQIALFRFDDRRPVGEEQRLALQVDCIFHEITTDRQLKSKFPRCNHNLKVVFRSLLNLDEILSFDLPKLRSIHLSLNLKRIHFFKFKYHFLNNYLKTSLPVERIFKGCERIENLRPYILNEKLEYDVYGGDYGISSISKAMYEKIFSDCTLSPYFEGIDLPTQALKFSRLFFQLIHHMDSPNYSNEVLRQRHEQYRLTNVHLTNFKFYLSKTMDQFDIPFKYRRLLLRRMDIYKYSIINKDCLQSIVNKFGYAQFIEMFVKSCMNDPQLYDLVLKRGKAKFQSHCENVFHYFFRYNVKAITRDDIEQVHKHKQIISEKVFNQLKDKAIKAVATLTSDKLVLQDFEEDWEEVKPLILGQERGTLIKQAGGQGMIKIWAQQIAFEMAQRQLHHIYEAEEVNLTQNLICKLNLLLYSVRFYKKTDLEVIHRRYKISDLQYYDFTQSFMVVFKDQPQFKFIFELLHEYRPYIIQE